MKKALLLFSICAIVFGSCSIERRLYRPGFSIQWYSVKKKVDKDIQGDDLTSDEKKEELSPDDQNTITLNSESAWNGSSTERISNNDALVDELEPEAGVSSTQNTGLSDNEDTTRVNIEEQEVPLEEDRYNEVRSSSKYGWVYIVLLILFYAILGAILYVGALYPFQTGVILLFPLSLLFGLEDRAGFLFGIFSGLSYVGLFFLSGSVGFWGIFFLGFLALMISLGLATMIDGFLDQGERKDDYPPPPPPQVDPGEDW